MALKLTCYQIKQITNLAIAIVMAILLNGHHHNVIAITPINLKTTEPIAQSDTPTLIKAQLMERDLQGGQSHTYTIAVEAGQYLEIKIEQQGVDVTAIVYEPNGKKVYEIDSPNGKRGIEPVYIISEINGHYKLEIVVNDKQAAPGKYKIELVDIKPATAIDRELCQAHVLTLQARKLFVAGKYREALPMAEQALAIREKLLKPEDPQLATTLHYLADIYNEIGDVASAEPLYQRSLTIREKIFGADHSEVASALNSMGNLYLNKGDHEKAEQLFQHGLAIRERIFGQESTEVAEILNNLAYIYGEQLNAEKALPLIERALEINEKVYGLDHYAIAHSLTIMADIYWILGKFDKAEPIYLRAVPILEKIYGPDNPILSRSLNGLGMTYTSQKNYDKAEKILLRVIAIEEKGYGPDYPYLTVPLNFLSGIYGQKGDIEKMLTYRERAEEVSERDLITNLSASSEKEKLIYIEGPYFEVWEAIMILRKFAPDNPRAIRLSLTMLLRRKGRSLDAMTNSIANLRRRANLEDQTLLDQLTKKRLQYSEISLRGPKDQNIEQHQTELKELAAEIEKLEKQASQLSAKFKVASQPITLEAVQQAIPDDAALIEIAAYYFQIKGVITPRYIAFVLTNQGDPQYVDLGEASAIELAVINLRGYLSNKKADINKELKSEARSFDKKVMEPIRKLIGNKKHLLISPDGVLNLIPFEALIDENGKYLIQNYQISYLTNGRDLLRLKNGIKNKQSPLILADPIFGNGSGPELGDETFDPLERLNATSVEANQIKIQLKQARLLTQSQATKQALLSVSSPEILHIATHGFFLKKSNDQGNEKQRDAIPSKGESDEDRAVAERRKRMKLKLQHPLLRSGLFLANANVKSEDSTLTALEVAGLDLWGTKLVVLSACDTGLGDVANGDGVYGLRRSLVLAGAESQVMSLWKVSDQATKDLMVAYYKALKAGKGRSAALRQVQLSFLKRPDRAHPYYWAGFIQSGEWANLDGKR